MRKFLTVFATFLMLFVFSTAIVMVKADNGGNKEMKIATEMKREEISLNGMWECQDMPFDEDISALPDVFTNKIPVPGLWDLAEKPFLYTKDRETLKGNYDQVALWYKKTLTFEGEIPARVTLKIHKAFWRKYIYVNGEFVAEHHPNFTAAYIDIAEYLQGNGAVNTLLIKIGDKGSQPFSLGHPTGYDPEKIHFVPGIYDDISLIISGEPRIDYVQVAPDIHNSIAKVKLTVSNRSNADAVSDVHFTVTDGNGFTKSATVENVCVLSGETKEIYGEVDMSGFEYWSPESPKLYTITAETDSDRICDTFGMREFYFDESTGTPVLNGEYRYLIGTNVPFYRFLEDPLRADLPWQESWVRSVLLKFKEMNMSIIRFHCGFVPDFWYDLCDELGIMVDDEWAMFGNYECQPKLYDDGNAPFLQEVKDWINERANHPSVVIWDIQNEVFKVEGFYPETSEVVDWAREQGLDLSGRPWDNGYQPPRESSDSIEVHPYLFINSSFRLSYLNFTDPDPVNSCDCLHFFNEEQSRSALAMPDNPRIINEYEWLWLNRDGTPCFLTESLYASLFPNGYTEADLRYYYAKAIAALTEFWRSGQKSVGIMGFSGLSYSRQGGYTSDSFLPDITNPQFHETYAKLVGDSYKDILICIEDWTEFRPYGKQSVPVSIINDTTKDVAKSVTLKLYKGNKAAFSLDEYTLVSTSVKEYNIAACGGKTTEYFEIEVPQENCVYKLVASYTDENGKTVDSVRDFEIGAAVPKQNTQNRILSNGCQVSVSSIEGENLRGEYLVDGDCSSRWGSLFNDDQWISLDLGEVCSLNSMFILWERGAAAKNYDVLLSEDGKQWTTAAVIVDGEYPKTTIELSGMARYVKINLKARYSNFGYSIYELKVFGKPATEKYAVGAMVMGSPAVGSVTGSAYVLAGESVKLTATANAGYVFTGWKVRGEIVGVSAEIDFIPVEDTVIYGVFRAKYTFGINALATAGGRTVGSGTYVEGDEVKLVAVSEKGYRFIGWYDGENLVSDDTVYAFTAEKDGEYVAKFEEYSKWEGSSETPETPDGSDGSDAFSETESSATAMKNESVSSEQATIGGCLSTLAEKATWLIYIRTIRLYSRR